MRENTKKEDRIFKGSTIGMIVNHPSLKESTLIRCEYYKKDNAIELHAVSGHNLSRIRSIPTVTISVDEYNEREWDACNDQKEFFWAMNKLGCE